MQWALTALVLSSVSLLVVTLSIEQGAQAVAHPADIAGSRARFPILRRILLAIAAAGVATGRSAGHIGRAAGQRIHALMQSTIDVIRLERRTLAERRAERQSRAKSPAFEESAQSTAPEMTGTATVQQPTWWFVPASYEAGWISRVVAMIELVAVIAVTGSAVAVVLLAVGWKATHLP
jgi:hypothetical protein